MAPRLSNIFARAPKDEVVFDKVSSPSSQNGGSLTSSWITILPKTWIPYVELARLSPPAAPFLIYFPHLFGTLHAANVQPSSISNLLRSCVLLLWASLFFSNAAHAWNDLVDAPIDRKVSRTKNRPIASGIISSRAAIIFMVSQSLIAASFLLLSSVSTAMATLPTILGTIYYPWAKLHTHFPQVILGFCLAWGVMVGSRFAGLRQPWNDQAGLCLVFASSCWTIIYDTIYAHQDVAEDIHLGVKSLAVLFGGHVKPLLWVVLFMMGVSLTLYGQLIEVTIGYYVITLGGCIFSLGSMIFNVRLSDKASCWKWFSTGFWITGTSITLGLLSHYVQVRSGYREGLSECCL
ncbi:UbiA-domain-containing protein [Lophiostoma macrostomum CBS 122681]|uniref:UbiA-domain-containing protein n=1 Tax=Lophiostoma macrostomum CBS 122681 TaxID=1314788 RepID=A0A6A6SIG0_9PLEO|nr:UbiA-domain-containing protein [Lophiostoma macrostomum CBS 122681]